jgi:hypothetical protein
MATDDTTDNPCRYCFCGSGTGTITTFPPDSPFLPGSPFSPATPGAPESPVAPGAPFSPGAPCGPGGPGTGTGTWTTFGCGATTVAGGGLTVFSHPANESRAIPMESDVEYFMLAAFHHVVDGMGDRTGTWRASNGCFWYLPLIVQL